MSQGTIDFHRTRERAERRAAEGAAHDSARASHWQLAELHAERAAVIAGGARPAND